MKRLPIFSVLFFLPLLIYSQINTSLDFVGGIDFSYRNINNTSNDTDVDNVVIPFRNNDESGKLNVRFGFNFNKRVSEKIFFKTGLRFASFGYKGNGKTNLRWGNQQTGGVFNPTLPGEFSDTLQFIDNFLFLEVPLIARFEFSQKKFTPFVEFGLAPSLYLKSRNKLVINSETIIVEGDEDLYDYNKIHFVGVLSFGGNYNLTEGLQLFAQPTFRYHLTRLVKDVPIKENLWTVGLELGLRKQIN